MGCCRLGAAPKQSIAAEICVLASGTSISIGRVSISAAKYISDDTPVLGTIRAYQSPIFEITTQWHAKREDS